MAMGNIYDWKMMRLNVKKYKYFGSIAAVDIIFSKESKARIAIVKEASVRKWNFLQGPKKPRNEIGRMLCLDCSIVWNRDYGPSEE